MPSVAATIAHSGPEPVADGSGPILSLLHVSRRFGATQALDDVTLEVMPGEVRGLVGENGAGKSTLMKVLSGAVEPDAGTIVIGGEVAHRLTPREARDRGISIVYQDADLVSSLTVADNVFLGRERAGTLGVVRHADQRRATQSVIDELGIALDPDALAGHLSAAERQLTQIVRALHSDPRVLVLDEPTTSLGRNEVRHLLDLLRRLAQRGIAIVYISHYLDEVLAVADRVTVLKDGRLVTTRESTALSATELAALMVGRDASAFFVKEEVPLGEELLRVTDLVGPGIRVPISFALRAGEVLGFGGLVGAGRTELMEALFGATTARGGTVTMAGHHRRPTNPRAAVVAGLGMVTEDRGGTGLFAGRSVRENIAVTKTETSGWVVAGERALADAMVDRLGIVVADIDQPVSTLSGGNQQKVVIGRWLAADATVLILDEPTKGVDIGAKQDIYRLIGGLLRAGKGVLLVSSDLPELLSLSDRIAVMRAGRLTTIVNAREATEESLMQAFLGVAA